jgi:2-amino-4-hydroxy-6-hydroxymethyldihydropteridine diphosphokinase
MNQAVIGLGSNIDPHKNIQKAKDILNRKFRIIAESEFKITKPIGDIQQPDFLNGTVFIETEFTTDALKAGLREIESTMGRNRAKDRFGPRTIDLDIVVWNNQVFDQDFYNREYLKRSVLELIPDLEY